MIVVYPYSLKDQEQAVRNAEWIRQLEGTLKNHRVLIVRDHRVKPEIWKTIEGIFIDVFDSIETLEVTNDAYDHWPESCNLMFGIAARHIAALERPEHWLWLEPDAIFLKKGVLDTLDAAYIAGGKPFMGDRVDVNNVPVHMSGVGIYPPRVIDHAGVALISQETAWDVMAAFQIVPLMHETKLIEHSWKHGTFEDWAAVEREVDLKNAVLFHSSKDGSLIDLLRVKHAQELLRLGETTAQNVGSAEKADSLPVSVPPSIPEIPQGSPSSTTSGADNGAAEPIVCDILIKTYPKDYEWLNYCLRGLQKFATGFRRVIIVHPANEERPGVPFEFPIPVQLIPVPENGNPYLFQQAVKFSAHQWTDATYILHIDSDTVPCAPFTPATFMRDNRPLWLMTPYSEVKTPWQLPTERFLGRPVEYEFMRRFPILVPRKLHVAAGHFCLATHSKTPTEYILSQETFSEFNALGAYAAYYLPFSFSWLDTTKETLPPLIAIQSWSHGGLTTDLREQFETILGSGACNHAESPGSVAPSAQAIHQTKEGWWVINHDTHISKWVEDEGRIDHDVWMLPRVLPEINIGDTVVDAGAFIGDHTVAYLNKTGPEGKVIAFEPNPAAAECCRRNTLGKAEVYQQALSNRKGPVLLEITPNVGASTIVTTTPGISVDAIPLDELNLGRLDFFKIDVEGHELKVLQGAEKTVERCLPKLLIEINKWSLLKQGGITSRHIFDWLKTHGYQWQAVQTLQIADPPQYDILCRPVTREAKNKSIIPWASRMESEQEIQKLVKRLHEFCTNAATTRIAKGELVIQGILRPRDLGYKWTLYRKKRNARKRRVKRFEPDEVKTMTPEEEEKSRIFREKKRLYMQRWLAKKRKEAGQNSDRRKA